MNNKLLPIGSVVTLEGAEKKSTIVGESLVQEDDDTISDYVGQIYHFQEGYTSIAKICFCLWLRILKLLILSDMSMQNPRHLELNMQNI